MWKDGLENVLFTGEIEDKRDKEKQPITYMVSSNEWIVEQVLMRGEEIHLSYKGHLIVESGNRQRPEWTRSIEEKE